MAKRPASTKSATTGRKPARTTASKKTGAAPKGKASVKEVPVDRRKKDRREATSQAAVPSQLERRKKVNRRRQIDPTTCERDYTDEEIEFMNALDVYKRKSGRMFPTCSEVLEVIRGLGYCKQAVQSPKPFSIPELVAEEELEGTDAFDTASLELVS